MALSNTYTVSPLGIVTGSVGSYGTASTYQSLLSSYSRNGVRRKLNKNTATYASGGSAVLSDKRHSDEIYDISTSNIIDKLDKPSTAHISLNYADFAYLKDFGVYPNNRLIVCRRYPVPVVDDLYSLPAKGNGKTQAPTPLSTVLGYVPQTEDFINFSFNEEWADADVSFTTLLNSLGEDFGFKGFQLGSILEGAANAMPLPGASLLLQRKIMTSLGFFGKGAYVDPDGGIFIGTGANKQPVATSGVPQGDPNLIKQALNRTLIDENKDGSGLKCKFNITLKTVYEQKFIQGVDPTIVFMDIMNNLLNLGTSNATFYLGKQTDAANNVSDYLKDFMENPFEKIKEFIESLVEAMGDQLKKFDEKMKKDKKSKGDSGGTSIPGDISKLISDQIDTTTGINYVKDFINQKYKVKFLGIINALTGGPSTPWHVTIGNPLRPIFCSGDMLTKSVNVKLGPQLSFNDLPTFIEVEVQLESARNLGLQEIFGKFNCGGIRTSTGDYIVDDSDSYWNTSTYPYSGTGSVALGSVALGSALGSQTITNMSAGVNNSSSSATGAPAVDAPVEEVASRTRVSPGGIPEKWSSWNQFE